PSPTDIYTLSLHDALPIYEDFDQYVHDNTDDEFTHFTFLNAYLKAKGAAPVNLDRFRTLQGSTATGVNRNLIGKRLTNLTQLTRSEEHTSELQSLTNLVCR